MWRRYQFYTSSVDDPRPVQFPPPGPYWVTGVSTDGTFAVVVAYLPVTASLRDYWPEATGITWTEHLGSLPTASLATRWIGSRERISHHDD